MSSFETTQDPIFTEPAESEDYRKSTFSVTDNCVEVGKGEAAGLEPGQVGIRDSKDSGKGPVLHFSEQAFAEFVVGVIKGEFGKSTQIPHPDTPQTES